MMTFHRHGAALVVLCFRFWSVDVAADCSVGFSNSSSSTPPFTCEKCLAGYYAATTTATVCSYCIAGEYQNGQGKSSCKTCAGGTYSDHDAATACTDCAPGTKAKNSGSSQCYSCSPGQYQDSSKKTKCNACANGEFVATAGATACEACPNGQFGLGVGATSCGLCATCATNQYINGTCSNLATSTANCLDCVETCAVGEYLDGAECDGTGNVDPRLNGSCITCTLATSCDAGYYGHTRNDCNGSYAVDGVVCRTCKTCPAGKYESTSCGAGSTSDVTACTVCANTLGSCAQHEYLSEACNGSTTVDVSTCSSCANQVCSAGQYLDACDGTGTADTSTCYNCTVCDTDEFPSGTACNGTGSSDTVQCLLCSEYCAANATGHYDTLANDGKECVYHCPAQTADDAEAQVMADLFSSTLVDTLHAPPYNFDPSFNISSFSVLDFSNQLAVTLNVDFYNERDILEDRSDALATAFASVVHRSQSDITVSAFVADLALQSASRTKLLYAGRLPTILNTTSCETTGFGAQSDYEDLAAYCASTCVSVGSSCVATSINTTTDECCLYSEFDDTQVEIAGNQDPKDSFFYSQTQSGGCFVPTTNVFNQQCPEREHRDDNGALVPNYYQQ